MAANEFPHTLWYKGGDEEQPSCKNPIPRLAFHQCHDPQRNDGCPNHGDYFRRVTAPARPPEKMKWLIENSIMPRPQVEHAM